MFRNWNVVLAGIETDCPGRRSISRASPPSNWRHILPEPSTTYQSSSTVLCTTARATSRGPRVDGRWTYVYRAVDQHGQVIDVLLSKRRDGAAARAFLSRAMSFGRRRVVVTTHRPPVKDATDEVLRHLPGFVSANVHRGLDGTTVVNYGQWVPRSLPIHARQPRRPRLARPTRPDRHPSARALRSRHHPPLRPHDHPSPATRRRGLTSLTHRTQASEPPVRDPNAGSQLRQWILQRDTEYKLRVITHRAGGRWSPPTSSETELHEVTLGPATQHGAPMRSKPRCGARPVGGHSADIVRGSSVLVGY